ncbi:hypothetical protein D3C87_1675490 [compost metagenome]
MAFGATGPDRGGIGVQGDELLIMFDQQFADQPPDPTEADDQHGAVGGRDVGAGAQALGLDVGGGRGLSGQGARHDRQQRHCEHAEGRGQHGLARQFRRGEALDQAGGQDDEGELARRAQHQGGLDGRPRGQTPGAGQDEDDQGLQHDQPARQPEDRGRVSCDGVKVQTDADADEEDA